MSEKNCIFVIVELKKNLYIRNRDIDATVL